MCLVTNDDVKVLGQTTQSEWLMTKTEKCFEILFVDKWQFFVSIFLMINGAGFHLWLGSNNKPWVRTNLFCGLIKTLFNVVILCCLVHYLGLFIITETVSEDQELAARSCQRSRQKELNGVADMAGCSINSL